MFDAKTCLVSKSLENQIHFEYVFFIIDDYFLF